MYGTTTYTTGTRRCGVTTTIAAVLLAMMAIGQLATVTEASAIRPATVVTARPNAITATDDSDDVVVVGAPQATDEPQHGLEYWYRRTLASLGRQRRSADGYQPLVRRKRTLLKLKPLIVLPAKVALGAGHKLVAGAKLGAKAVGIGSKALGVGLVGLKAVHKVAKVTVKAATALGVKAVLLNFLFQKINQIIDFKTRLLGNLDQKNRVQNAQFLAVTGTVTTAPINKVGSIGNKEDDDFLTGNTASDQQTLAQEQVPKSALPIEDEEVTFDANKVSLQVPDRLFGPSFTAVNGISQTIGTVIQNTANRLARLVDAIKSAVFRKISGVSSLSNSSGRFGGKGAAATDDSTTAARGLRDAADDLDSFPLDDDLSAATSTTKAVKSSVANNSKNNNNGSTVVKA